VAQNLPNFALAQSIPHLEAGAADKANRGLTILLFISVDLAGG
jgi:hypothetical protein